MSKTLINKWHKTINFAGVIFNSHVEVDVSDSFKLPEELKGFFEEKKAKKVEFYSSDLKKKRIHGGE